MNTHTIHQHKSTLPVLGALLLAAWINVAFSPGVCSAGQDKAKEASKIYTAYNIWYEKPMKVSSINYRRGVMLPAGTELSSIQVGNAGGRRPYVRITTAQGKATYTIYFRKKFHPGMTVEKFKNRLATNKTFEEMTSGLTEDEIGAIKSGRLIVGMSKDSVVISRGYPPEHRTPSLEANQWLYWENRFRKKAVYFDGEGRTTRSGSQGDDL